MRFPRPHPLAAVIIAFTLVFAALGAWKYAHYRYTGMDLAYFAQVFWNTAHGRPFAQSLHPHLSLGDHAELAVLPLALPYLLWQDPRMLLLLQALALALPAWPLFLLARRRFAGTPLERLGPPAVAAAWLLYPAVQNAALYEFHVLPFALAPLAFALLAYERERKLPFLLWCLAALLAREDVALVVAAIGLMAWLEKRKPWWILAPLLLGAAWFAAATRLIAVFSTGGGYKYSVYYAWLGATPLEAVTAPFTRPLELLRHVATLPHLELALGLAFPLLFLPLARPKRLVLALGPILQTILSAQGGGAITFQTHYAALFLPGLFLAAVEGLRAAPAMFTRMRFPFGAREAVAGLVIASAYGALTLGPLPAAFAAMADDASRVERIQGDAVVASVPDGASVAASYRLLPHLASRERLFSINYHFLGVTQFAEAPYAAPAADVVAWDRRDLLTYRAQYEGSAWASPHLAGGEERLRALMPVEGRIVGPYRLLGAENVVQPPAYVAVVPTPPGLPAGTVLHAEISAGGVTRSVELPVETPATPVAIPVDGLRPGPIAFRARFAQQSAIFALDALRTPVRMTVTDATLPVAAGF